MSQNMAEMIRNRKGSAGSHGSWKLTVIDSDKLPGGYAYELRHYGHLMLRWYETSRGDIEIIDISTGYGTVSDQGGMNQAFRMLNLPYYYSRKGGAEIIER